MRADPSGHAWYNVMWDWINTIAGFVNPISTITALGALGVAAVKGRGDEIAEDWQNGCLNPFNQSADIALRSNVLSFYKGSSVVRQNVFGTSSALGTIWSNSGTDTIDLQHEYGHSVQERFLGFSYWPSIAIPSVAGYLYDVKYGLSGKEYYSFPWERTADWLGGVDRSSGYKDGSLGWSISENLLGVAVIPFYFWFGY
jgi:hypothetical protein